MSGKNVALGLLGGATGLSMMGASKDRLIGQKTLYHGTSNENWKNIKEGGLKAERGGSGGAADMGGYNLARYKNGSKGYIHATASKSKARSYGKIGEVANRWTKTENYKQLRDLQNKYKVEEDGKYRLEFPDTEQGEIDKKRYKELNAKRKRVDRNIWVNPLAQKGKVIQIKMPYDKWKNDFILDPDEKGKVFKGKGRFAESIGKDIAGKTRKDIGKDEIVGLHNPKDRYEQRKKDLPNYIRNNPGRFGAGVALGTGGALLTGKSANMLRKQAKRAILKRAEEMM